MHLHDFHGCCTATILTGFGGTSTAEYGSYKQPNYSELRDEIVSQLNSTPSKFAVVTATTNDQQTIANKVLEDLGFKHSKWMTKTQHSETKLRLWFMPMMDWEKK